jgi:hypothetical protein
MRTLSSMILFGVLVGVLPMVAGCGESSDKPTVVVPPEPPAVTSKASMQAYLKDHPAAAKKADKTIAK